MARGAAPAPVSVALERTLFLLARCRLLLLELRDVERQLERLASTAAPSEKPLVDDAREVLAGAVGSAHTARARLDDLSLRIEAEAGGSPEAT